MMKMVKKALILMGAVLLVFALTSGKGGGSSKSKAPQGIDANWEWVVNGDEDNGGSSTIKMEVIDIGGATAHHFSGNITNKYEYGFVNVKIQPADDEAAELLKTLKSFSFKVKGDGQRYAVKMPTKDITDYCYWETVFETEESGETVDVKIDVDMLIQPTWGTYKNFTQSEVFIIEFQTTRNGNPGTYDFTLWDFKVYK
jgi:hypothetical protein